MSNYSMDDMNKATYIQAKSINDGKAVTIKEYLKELTPITNLSEYKKSYNNFSTDKVENLDLNSISTYGLEIIIVLENGKS